MARKSAVFQTIVIVVLAWRMILFGIANQADRLVPYQPSFPYANELLAATELPRWLYSWGNFDGVHYLTIIERGYVGTAAIQAFFPVFPLVLKLFSSPLLVGVVLNGLLLVGLAYLMYLLVKIDQSRKMAWWAMTALLLFPTSFFLGAFYSETLFLLLVFGSFYFARKKQWWWAAILAGVASGTRIVGVLLWPALIYELWLQYRSPSLKAFWQSNKKQLLVLSLSLTGLLVYMVYLQKTFGDPLYFFHVQSEFGSGRQETLILFPQVIWRYFKILWTTRPFDWKYFAYLQELVLSLGTLGAFLIWYKKIRPSYLLWSLLAFFLPTLTGTLSSMPRYILVCFPLFFLLGELYAKRPGWRVLLLTGSVVLLIINTMLFIQGYWVA